jgi:CHASE2 domain-containing sensor protein
MPTINERTEMLAESAISTNTVVSVGTKITLAGTWLASIAGWVSPVLGMLAAIVLFGYYVWKWVSDYKLKSLEIKIKQEELNRLAHAKVKPLHKEK